ncbi:MAG: Outer membrane efflux protein BepC [Alphaproteobacteria bacterium MarineAlpha11_Bin1]|nr:MAG: Outer membrane efflux protein BepC [Alphaproteobacteria bacterium MarineAlpha11_Bin1]|tara:strand:- start:5 stop:1381 length:1377 start_codon:yes stop_codon:yes gene_type:complete
MKFLKFWVALTIGFVNIWSLDSAGAQTLDEALVKAYRENPRIRAERARLRASDEGVSQALSNWRPVVRVTGTTGLKRSDSTITGPAAKEAEVTEPFTAELTITQNLYRGGRTEAEVEEAEYIVRADRARLALTEQSVLLGAATAYGDVARDQAVLELNKSNERVLEKQLEATEDRFRVGEVTKTEVSQAESRLSRARADRIAANGTLIDARAAYKNVVGDLPDKLQLEKPLTDLPSSLPDAIDRAKSNNFGVILSRLITKAAESNVRKINGELLPSLTLNGSAQINEETTTPRSESQVLSMTAKITVPLYASGSVRSRIRAAKQIVSQRRDEFNQAVRDAIEDTTEAWQILQTGRAQIQAFRSAVKAAEIALEGVREEVNVGSRNVLDVLDAEQELLDARVGVARTMRDELVATYRLRSAVGELTAVKLGLPVKFYDPGKHHQRARGKWWGLSADDGR